MGTKTQLRKSGTVYKLEVWATARNKEDEVMEQQSAIERLCKTAPGEDIAVTVFLICTTDSHGTGMLTV